MNLTNSKSATHENSTPAATRRSFLAGAASLPFATGVSRAGLAAPTHTAKRSSAIDLLRVPDAVTLYERLDEPRTLQRSGERWQGQGVEVATQTSPSQVEVHVAAPGAPVRYIHLRWRAAVAQNIVVLGDHWERSYGDLGWRCLLPERVLPWYFATWDGSACHAYGVKTQPGALCFWQVDPAGVSLWLNLSNGGSGVHLGGRTLLAATIVARQGKPGESPNTALTAFCRQMCSAPSLPFEPVYGTNDWYYAYGQNSAKLILADTDFVASLSTGNKVRPFSVIDMGWADGSATFPSMADVAAKIRQRQVRPGIWIRPLEAQADTKQALLLPDRRFGDVGTHASTPAYDPTEPKAMEAVLAKVNEVMTWGFELVKHDFSTYDLLGRWGFQMGADPTGSGWALHDKTRTNAEVMLDLYRQIRSRCRPGTLIIGCNTVGHLGQGIFDIQRTGDDTSGKQWERTRRMGVNTLAFRLPQHRTFFIQDADCVGISPAVPWQYNQQWMNLLAHSGTALFLSPGEGSRSPEVMEAIRRAFAIAATGGTGAVPLDTLESNTPERWQSTRGSAGATALQFHWEEPEGAFPFSV